ncbi:MAG: RNA polymerase sigma factor [Lachnospiraceae bacterium]|nr:RNA polymerase sigma factor [Lachnospiraceae bacterium]
MIERRVGSVEDRKIIELYFGRDEQALQETSEKYGPYIRKIAGNILGNHEDAEECANESLFRAWNTIPPNRPKSLPAYLALLTREVSIDRFRKNTRLKRAGSEYALSYDELSEVLADTKSESDDVIDRIYLGELLNRFLSGRPQELRNILIMRYFYMDSIQEIADCTGSSVSRIKTALHREREALRKFLKEEGYER